MSRSRAIARAAEPPKELLPFLKPPPLVGQEREEDYHKLCAAIAPAEMPKDTVAWLLLDTIIDATWELRREKALKAATIEILLKEVVLDLLKDTVDATDSIEAQRYRIFDASDEADRWARGGKARKEIEAKLARRGYSEAELLARAYSKDERQIESIDRRITVQEVRRMTAIRELERRNDRIARHAEKSSSAIIDAEYSEAAE